MKFKKSIIGIFMIVSLASFFTIPLLSNKSIDQNRLNTSQGEIFDSFYADYIFQFMGGFVNTRFEYNHVSGDLYNVTWLFDGVPGATWIENKQNRLISNSSGSMSFDDGTHAALWIYNNLTLTNITLITIDGDGDYPFQVDSELNVSIFGIGNLEAWVLQNLVFIDSYAIYEKSTGLLLYGLFEFSFDYYTLQLTNTNMFSHIAGSDGIPGFNLLFIIPIIALISVVLVKVKLKNK
jgi:hypothetical protein